ncbi:hypothetical protein PYX06_07365 [Citrobacter amalonaticus]|nr:hypothetical protein [Citrobacter amalonaticus]
MDAAAGFFGFSTPIRDASFNVDYDLHWRNPPWQPEEASLNGIIRTRLGKGGDHRAKHRARGAVAASAELRRAAA